MRYTEVGWGRERVQGGDNVPAGPRLAGTG